MLSALRDVFPTGVARKLVRQVVPALADVVARRSAGPATRDLFRFI
jgi:hypothetical protein